MCSLLSADQASSALLIPLFQDSLEVFYHVLQSVHIQALSQVLVLRADYEVALGLLLHLHLHRHHPHTTVLSGGGGGTDLRAGRAGTLVFLKSDHHHQYSPLPRLGRRILPGRGRHTRANLPCPPTVAPSPPPTLFPTPSLSIV